MVKKVLFVFWHGVGDCILATPAFREYHKKNPNTKISIAVKQSVYDSKFFEECDYIDNIYVISNPWDYNLKQEGKKVLDREVSSILSKNKIDEVIYIPQYLLHGVHKITRVYREIGLGRVTNKKTEVYISKNDEKKAKQWLEKNNKKDFIFLHKKSELPKKDLPEEIANKFISNNFKDSDIIEPGISYDIKNKSIGFSFAILKQAKGIIVVDSAFMHAADALRKPIDYAYFNLRPGVSSEVKPLNVKCNIVQGPNERKVIKRVESEIIRKPIMFICGIIYDFYKKLKLN